MKRIYILDLYSFSRMRVTTFTTILFNACWNMICLRSRTQPHVDFELVQVDVNTRPGPS